MAKVKQAHEVWGWPMDQRYALVHMPKLEVLDMSENPIEDDEIRVTLLIDTLSTLKRPLKPLSVADNDPTSAGLSG
ncbi:hypothetical protein FF1_035553 [Malus domestica]